ncbi:M16 family metallopeptidase [Sandaracinus amylolyticus]|uniref:M16 family metallopeptidase n=1 Tax=Sandaracinus amylolyticus TaxID=927083 RepID=UPI001F35203D|nr:pitrilysin family protein [Sandaracinus amylolyticus]UJR82084.1 Zn-dependent peptidase [Sandaracinus amylolyticus]
MTRARLSLFALIAIALTTVIAVAQERPASPERAARRSPPPSEAPRPSDAIFPNRPEVERLPNGLTVVTVQWPSPGIVAYYSMVRVGSRDEVEEGHSGFAHFFEHMMFRGTERHSQHEYERTLQGFGADNNAFTSQDYTCYTITAPTRALPTVIELEADRFQHLSYDENVFRTEAGAVRGEYQVWSSNPSQPLWESLSEMAFTRHTYGHTTIGYLRDIEAMPTRYEYARQFFRRYYTPDNTTLIVVGDYGDRAALMAKIREQYGAWRGRRDRPRIPTEPEPTQGARRDLPWAGATPPRMFVGWRIPAFESTDARRREAALRETAALQIVHDLAFDESSPLYQRLVVQDQSVLELESWAGEQTRDPGLLVVTAAMTPGQAFDPILDAIQAEMTRIGAGEIPAERVRAVQQHLRYALAMGLETPSSVAGFIAGMLAVSGRIEAIDDYLRALEQVTPEDVARVARTYLVPERRYVATLAQREGGAQ